MNFYAPATTNSTEVKVAKLYIFLLPFRMIAPLSFLKDIIGPLANYCDTIVLLLGLILWARNSINFSISKPDKPLYKTIKYSIFYLNISSVIMATVIYLTYGDYNGISPFIAIIPMELFYFQYLLMFLYNIRVFSLLNYKTIVNIISKVCKVLLVIGYIQVLAMLNIGSAIYNILAKFVGGFLLTSQMTKLSLTCSEGAGAGILLGIFVFPFLFARYIYGDKKSLYQVLLWLIPLYFTKSSTAYALFVLDAAIFMYLLIQKSNFSQLVIKIFSITIILGGSIAILSATGILNADIYDKISYLLFEKATDETSGSTASRSVPFIINWGCFTEMPLLGVGNGLQGYFYLKYFPMYLLSVPGTDLGIFYERILEGGIANGSTFLPGYFSGYGIAGLIVLANFIIKLRNSRKRRARNLGLFNEMFIMGSVSFLIAALTSEMYCLYFAWFVLAIPFMNYKFSKS